ncbi:MAG: hypothetical protein ABL995_08900 [Bryobacteraceae bacterium]
MIPRKPFVYIMESPSPKDVFNDISEGDHLKKLLLLASIDSRYRRISDRERFRQAAAELSSLAAKIGKRPVLLHVSAHGNSDGIVLTSGEILPWADFRELLLPLNGGLTGPLILCMSSCEGFAACRMAMYEEQALPFFGVIGHAGTPTWGDTAAAFHTFYHLYAKGYGVEEAVKAMRIACGDDEFYATLASDARGAYLNVAQHQPQPNLSDASINPVAVTDDSCLTKESTSSNLFRV